MDLQKTDDRRQKTDDREQMTYRKAQGMKLPFRITVADFSSVL
jgi:hypothetical protein